jgi:hypothetical protein
LDLLTAKPLEVKLSEEQKGKIQEKLKELGEKRELSEEDAKTTLDAILDHKEGRGDTMMQPVNS